ncbi:unknown protein [Seminavis robusta]|uniref:Uncharacterized protein n=1 Tax=Seminavis robusta TaxID=568900 RepID=A0A9N8I193_9STRA|nr:unknown protein [Seminavis robusta]|eukprot:Sro3269_g346050.1 n/a (167) ;mRNA; r:2503-3003
MILALRRGQTNKGLDKKAADTKRRISLKILPAVTVKNLAMMAVTLLLCLKHTDPNPFLDVNGIQPMPTTLLRARVLQNQHPGAYAVGGMGNHFSANNHSITHNAENVPFDITGRSTTENNGLPVANQVAEKSNLPVADLETEHSNLREKRDDSPLVVFGTIYTSFV